MTQGEMFSDLALEQQHDSMIKALTMKQTAVEWLVNEANLLENNGWILPLIEQAKEMEAEQIENAFDSGWERADETKHQAYTTLEDRGSNYYNETFKNK